jgi:uncharacterized membrane protein YeiH
MTIRRNCSNKYDAFIQILAGMFRGRRFSRYITVTKALHIAETAFANGRNIPAACKGVLLFMGLTTLFVWNSAGNLHHAMDLASTAIFAYGGSLIFIQFKRVSMFFIPPTALLCGSLTAVGGGTVRCMLLAQTPFWLSEMDYVAVVFLGVLACLISKIRHLHNADEDILAAADSCALGVSVAIGVEHALALTNLTGMETFTLALAFGALTGTGGGLIRDILLRRPPTVFCTTYGLAGLAGAALHITLYKLDINGAWLFSGLVTALMAYVTRHANVMRYGSEKNPESISPHNRSYQRVHSCDN